MSQDTEVKTSVWSESVIPSQCKFECQHVVTSDTSASFVFLNFLLRETALKTTHALSTNQRKANFQNLNTLKPTTCVLDSLSASQNVFFQSNAIELAMCVAQKTEHLKPTFFSINVEHHLRHDQQYCDTDHIFVKGMKANYSSRQDYISLQFITDCFCACHESRNALHD